MLYFTVIVREPDCLALAADTENTGADVERYKLTSKNILKKLITSPLRQQSNYLTVDSSQYHYHILCDQGVMFLTMCESSFNANVAFSYLEDVSKEFLLQYGGQIAQVSRPYPFIKFDLYLQKTKKVFTSSRGSSVAMARTGRPPILRVPFRDVMGYADASTAKKGSSASGGSVDNGTLMLMLGAGAILLVFIVVMVYALM
jgi:hypothetical protein